MSISEVLRAFNKHLLGFDGGEKDKTSQSDVAPSGSSIPASFKKELRSSAKHIQAVEEPLDLTTSQTFKVPIKNAVETSPNAEDIGRVSWMANHMEESLDNLEKFGTARIGAGFGLAHSVSVGIEEDHICDVCQGSQKTCDCSLRQLIRWKSQRWEFITAKTITCEGGPGPFLIENRIEYRQRFANAGWAKAPNQTAKNSHIFIDRLASRDERREFLRPPIKEVASSALLPPGWRRVENVFGRIHYEHLASGLGMYRHPSGWPRVNQSTGYPIIFFTTQGQDQNHRRIPDQPTKSGTQYFIAGTEEEKPNYNKWIFDDPEAPCQLSAQMFPNWPKYFQSDWLKRLADKREYLCSAPELNFSQAHLGIEGKDKICACFKCHVCCARD